MSPSLSRPTAIARIAPSVLARTVLIGAVGALALGGVAAAATAPAGTGAHRFGPGAFGKVAAIAGTSMEVQSTTTGQTTVDWTSSTTFAQTATVSLSSIAVGDCVTVTGKTSKKTVTASSVSVSQPPSSGTCTGSNVGGPGGFGPGATRPAGNFTPPSGRSGSFARRFSGKGFAGGHGFSGLADFGFASGKVTAVGSSSLTLDGVSSADLTSSGAAGAKKAKTASAKTKKSAASATKVPQLKKETFSVTVNSSTTYTENESATASNLAVGDCVTASGKTATNGTVTATVVRITSTGASSCTGGFGFFGGAGPTAASGTGSA